MFIKCNLLFGKNIEVYWFIRSEVIVTKISEHNVLSSKFENKRHLSFSKFWRNTKEII